MEARFNITHTLTPEQHKLYCHVLYSRLLKGQRICTMIATAVMLILTPYLFVDDSQIALMFASVLTFLFVSAVFLVQRQTMVHRFIFGKRYEKFPVQYSIYEDMIRIVFSAPNYQPVSISYDKILDCVETNDAMILMSKIESAAIVLPKNAFTLEDLNEIRVFIKEKTEKEFRTIE